MTPPDEEPQIVGFARAIAEGGGVRVYHATVEQYAVEYLASSERLAGEVWAAIDGVAVVRTDGVKVYVARTLLTEVEGHRDEWMQRALENGSQERTRAKAAEIALREAEKLAERIISDNDVPEMYGAGQRRAAERILSVLKHGRTTSTDGDNNDPA